MSTRIVVTIEGPELDIHISVPDPFEKVLRDWQDDATKLCMCVDHQDVYAQFVPADSPRDEFGNPYGWDRSWTICDEQQYQQRKGGELDERPA